MNSVLALSQIQSKQKTKKQTNGTWMGVNCISDFYPLPLRLHMEGALVSPVSINLEE